MSYSIETDEGMDRLIRDAGRYLVRRVIDKLFRGNDTQCFTTEQFRAAYINDRYPDGGGDWLGEAMDDGHIAKQMTEAGLTMVGPNVWAKR